MSDDMVKSFADELRLWWNVDMNHSREDFIEQKLPELIAEIKRQAACEPTEVVSPRKVAEIVEPIAREHAADCPQRWKPPEDNK